MENFKTFSISSPNYFLSHHTVSDRSRAKKVFRFSAIFRIQLANVESANAESANAESANAESANAESANAESANAENQRMSKQRMSKII